MPLLSDSARADFEARMTARPEVISLEGLEGAVIGSLSPHLQAAWHSLNEHEPNAGVWFGETVAQLEEDITKLMRHRVLQVLVGKEFRDLGIDIGNDDEVQG